MLKNLIGYFIVTLCIGAVTATATNRYIDPAGTDVGDCSNSLMPCLTLQYAVNQSVANDVINAAAGTYPVAGIVTINITLTLLGAQAGVDARTRVALESILSNTQGIRVAANNVVIDGFTIQDSTNNVFTGYGLWLDPSVSVDGTQVINNIFTKNIIGLGVANLGTTQMLVKHNLFIDNNRAGSSSGTGIYTDEFAGGTVSNVLITENKFENNENAGIAFSSTMPATPDTNITITDNQINNCGRGIYFLSTMNATVTGNTITNLPAPTDGGNSAALSFFGGNTNIVATNNDFQTGVRFGVRFVELIPSNANIQVHRNNITGFATAALQVNDPPSSPDDFATCNWWGSATGPTNPALNPAGTGDVVAGTLTFNNFFPWLLAPAPDGPCGMPPTVTKTFNPDMICQGDTSTLTIRFTNPNNMIAVFTEIFIDGLPEGMEIKGNGSNSCGGVLVANPGSRVIKLSAGSILGNDSCTIVVDVKGINDGVLNNIIPVGTLQTNLGNNDVAASAALTVVATGIANHKINCIQNKEGDGDNGDIDPSNFPGGDIGTDDTSFTPQGPPVNAPKDNRWTFDPPPSAPNATAQAEDKTTQSGCTSASVSNIWIVMALIAYAVMRARKHHRGV